MQLSLKPLLIPLACALLLPPTARADEATIESIQKERETVLSQILEQEKAQFASGSPSTLDAVELAEARLHAFRRDQAKTIPDKIPHQELVVKAFERRYQNRKATYDAGQSVTMNLLKDLEDLLKEKQLLLELKSE